ncbi:MAG TPA: hypothetical protein VKM94_11155 [Blastocatellia bacterium]|nr:hypothetical protein [Blastocatellia bacterium]
MSNTEHEVVRRALEAALSALESGRPASTGPNGPVVVIVVPPPAGGSSDAESTGKPQAAIGESCHPSLEKFPVVVSADAGAGDKSCFMEPERRCVNSGACEMRGY